MSRYCIINPGRKNLIMARETWDIFMNKMIRAKVWRVRRKRTQIGRDHHSQWEMEVICEKMACPLWLSIIFIETISQGIRVLEGYANWELYSATNDFSLEIFGNRREMIPNGPWTKDLLWWLWYSLIKICQRTQLNFHFYPSFQRHVM